jgi:hypothetical protein
MKKQKIKEDGAKSRSTNLFRLRFVLVLLRGPILSGVLSDVIRTSFVCLVIPAQESCAIEIVEFVDSIDLNELRRRNISVSNRCSTLFIDIVNRCQANACLCRFEDRDEF